MSQGEVRFAERNGVKALLLSGEVRYSLAPVLERYLKGLFSEPAPRAFIVDLSKTDMLDSTVLGMLAKLGIWMRKFDAAPKVTLYAPTEDVSDQLIGVGFDEVFNIVATADEKYCDSEEIAYSDAQDPDLRRIVLDAHRTLMNLNESNREEFQNLVKLLESDASTPI